MLLSLGDELAQAAADDENGTSLANNDSLSGTENDTGMSTSFSGSDTAVSRYIFSQVPAGAEMWGVKCE